MRSSAVAALALSSLLIVAPAAAMDQPGAPETSGAAIDLGPLGEVTDVTTAGTAVGLGTGQPDADDPTREYVVQSPLALDPVLPESIDYDPVTKTFFTASFLNGAIYQGTLSADTTRVFAPPLSGGLMRLGVRVAGGKLFVANTLQATVDVFDIATRTLEQTLSIGLGGLAIDVIVDPAGDVYITDAVRPILHRVTKADFTARTGVVQQIPLPADVMALPPAARLNGVFGANGIVAAGPGRLVIGQTNRDRLFSVVVGVDPTRPTVTQLAVDGPTANVDGLELIGSTLYAIDNLGSTLIELRLASDLRSARVLSRTTDPTFSTPTAVVSTGDRLLVVNSQLFTTPMTTPATVSSIALPSTRRAAVRPVAAPTSAAPGSSAPVATRPSSAGAVPVTAGSGSAGPDLAATGAPGALGLGAALLAGGLLLRRRDRLRPSQSAIS